jgi:hypothetical protein
MKCFSIKSVALAVVLSLSFHIASAEWVQSNGPWGGYIRALAASGDTVFAGTPIGLFMSVNRGVNWAHVKNGLPAGVFPVPPTGGRHGPIMLPIIFAITV